MSSADNTALNGDDNLEVKCPACKMSMKAGSMSAHLDRGCPSARKSPPPPTASSRSQPSSQNAAPIFSNSSTSAHNSEKQAKRGPSSTRKDNPRPTKRRRPLATETTSVPMDAPLANRLRPRTWDEFVGQDHLTAPESLFLANLRAGSLGSVIMWGPPGCGKTTLARLMAEECDADIRELSATDVGVAEVRSVVEEAQKAMTSRRRKTILFLDEIHRFNRSQQDVFLPFVERGVIQLIGTTTENPSFKVTSTLMSRCRVVTLDKLSDISIRKILYNALRRLIPDDAAKTALADTEQHAGSSSQLTQSSIVDSETVIGSQPYSTIVESKYPHITEDIINSISSLSTGDARVALSLLEFSLACPPETKPSALLASLKQSVSTSYDRSGDPHYETISALHKSIRGGDGNAALFWLARMLIAGEDPLFIARRLIVVASEDVGLANERALPLATATMVACQNIGMPECRKNLSHCVAYLAESPKSIRALEAYERAEEAARQFSALPIPFEMRNAPTGLMKAMGYGEGYNYNPQFLHPVHNNYLPSEIREKKFLYESDTTGKEWNESLLTKWEKVENNGQSWEGRVSKHI